MRILKIAIVVILTGLALSACGGEVTPTPAPLPLPASDATASATTAVIPPTATSNPATLPPPPTIAPLPTSTALAASPTPEPIVLMSSVDFGTDRNPLTGELVADPTVLQRRPIACKLSNAPGNFTRPQSGINDADILFEHVTEGRLTRFTAIFYGKTPADIGPIRSARLIDIELPAMYDAGLCYSGTSAGVGQRMGRSDFTGRLLYSEQDGYYRTGADKPYEHTLYAHPDQLWQGLERRGQNTPPSFQNNMHFSSLPPAGGEPAASIQIDYITEKVEWRYDVGNGRYWRWSDGEIHEDANTGAQVNYQNVVVAFVTTVEDATICEQIANGVCVALSLEIQLWGTGRAVIFRDGLAYEATWHREDRHDMLTFTDANGDPLPLQIGNTMMQLVTNHRQNQLAFTP